MIPFHAVKGTESYPPPLQQDFKVLGPHLKNSKGPSKLLDLLETFREI